MSAGTMLMVDELSRVQMQVLAALSFAPLGVSSVRSLARRAGVSSTAAGRASAALEARGLAHRVKDPTAGGRRASRASVGASEWRALAHHLERVLLPAASRDEADPL